MASALATLSQNSSRAGVLYVGVVTRCLLAPALLLLPIRVMGCRNVELLHSKGARTAKVAPAQRKADQQARTLVRQERMKVKRFYAACGVKVVCAHQLQSLH